MAAIFSFMGGDLPEGLKRLLMDTEDPEKNRMRHDIQMRDRRAFWESLTKDQIRYLLLELSRIAHASDEDDARAVASMLVGTGEGIMMTKFNSCGCGQKHRQPEDFLGDLEREFQEQVAREKELEELNLAEITSGPFINPEFVGQFRCTKCESVFATVEERREAAVGNSHTHCKE